MFDSAGATSRWSDGFGETRPERSIEGLLPTCGVSRDNLHRLKNFKELILVKKSLENIIKIAAGMDDESLEEIAKVYELVI